MFIEGVHFLRETHKPAEAGRKALARSLSDIAAMGGAPRFCLVSLCVPEWANAKWVQGFFDGILELGTVLAGGDLSHGEKLALRRERLCRRGPAEGYRLAVATAPAPATTSTVSGTLGRLSTRPRDNEGQSPQTPRSTPEPRLALGQFLREKLQATSAIDISDGLSLDLRRLCLASNVSAEIGAPPRFPGATLEQSLHGGEEYELLFTVRGGMKVPTAFEKIPLTRIGKVDRGLAGEVRFEGKPLPPMGYDHFNAHR